MAKTTRLPFLPCEVCGKVTNRKKRTYNSTRTGDRYAVPITCMGPGTTCRERVEMPCPIPEHRGAIGLRAGFEVGGGCHLCEHVRSRCDECIRGMWCYSREQQEAIGDVQRQEPWLCEGGCGKHGVQENDEWDLYEGVTGVWCGYCLQVEAHCRRYKVADLAELAALRPRADAFLGRVSDVLRRSGVEDAELLIGRIEAMVRRSTESDVFAHCRETPSEALAMHVAEQAVTGGET